MCMSMTSSTSLMAAILFLRTYTHIEELQLQAGPSLLSNSDRSSRRRVISKPPITMTCVLSQYHVVTASNGHSGVSEPPFSSACHYTAHSSAAQTTAAPDPRDDSPVEADV